MKLARVLLVAAISLTVLSAMLVGATALVPPKPSGLPTGGVPGCGRGSHREVTIPAGATVAFSCPTHILVESQDEDVPTTLVISR